MSTALTVTPALPVLPAPHPQAPASTRPAVDGRRRRVPLRLAAAAVAGLLLLVAFPPYGAWPLAPVGVAVLALAVRGAGSRVGAGLGALFGLAFFGPLVHFTAVVGAVPWLVLSAVLVGESALLGIGLALVARRPGWTIWTTGVWVAFEAVRDRVPFGGFPWGRLAFSQPGTPLTPLAALGGAPLVTAAVALVGALLAAAVLATHRHRPVTAAGAAALAVAAGAAGLAVPLPTAGQTAGGPAQVTVAVVQGNVPRLGLDLGAQRAAVLTNHVRRTEELAAAVRAGRTAVPDLVLWPENSTDIDPTTDPQAAALIEQASAAIDRPILVGALLDGPGPDHVSNTGLVWDPATGPGERYVKRHPVPFAEYIPWRRELAPLFPQVRLVPTDFAAGRRPGVLDVGPARLGDVICFEVAYDAITREAVTHGGRAIVVQTNNATFGRSGETWQQLAMGRLRAVEHGRTVLVAATSGVSAVISPAGRVVEQSAVFTPDVLVQTIALRDSRTIADRVGVLPEAVLAAIGAVGLLLALAGGRGAGRSRAGGRGAARRGAGRRQAARRQADR